MQRSIVTAVAGLGLALPTAMTAAGQPYLNNTCATAPAVPGCNATVPLRFQTPYAEDNERRPSCAGNMAYYNSVWVKFVAETPFVTVDTCGADTALIADSMISVYSASNPDSPCTSLVEIACLDDTPGCGDDETSPRIEGLLVTPGDTYYIQVGVFGYGGGACGGMAPCTNGDYTLSITCTQPQPCPFEYPDAPTEDELAPCNSYSRINEGCNRSPAAFSAVRISEARRGTGYAEATGDVDQDWYRFVVPGPTPVDVTLWAQSQFVALARLLRVDADICDTTTLLLESVPDCRPWQPIATASLEPGVYYLVMTPETCAGLVPCNYYRRDYLFSLVTTPLVTPVGACCTTDACVEIMESECAGLGGVHLGDGTACTATSCYSCPEEGMYENEQLPCPAHGYVDHTNAGCDATPSIGYHFTDIASGQTWCASTATYFNVAPPNATYNQRDSDWYRIMLADVPVQHFRRLHLTFRIEAPLEILVYNPDASSTCSGFSSSNSPPLVSRTVIQAGQLSLVTACVQKRGSASGGLGDALIVIRPASRGTPREIPCGRRYHFAVAIEPCDAPGACCITTSDGVAQGCQMLTAHECYVAGGQFAGEDGSCTDICCPCPNGTTPENEPTCGDPNDTVNGGCNAAGFGYPFNTTALATPGSAVCGTTRFNGSRRDTDWYAYNHPGGDIVYTIVPSDFIPVGLILKPGASTAPQDQCGGLIILASAVGLSCEALTITAPSQPAGVYWLWAGPTFDATLSCGRSYYATVNAVAPPTGGSCCLPEGNPGRPHGGCTILSQAACTAGGGEYGGDGTDCDPNPCPACPVVCSPDAAPEGEPLCNTGPNINAGCDAGVHNFSPLPASSAAAVCGTTRLPASGEADTDWYDCQHAGGDLAWAIRAEFVGRVRVVGPIYNDDHPCCASFDEREYDFGASCTVEFGALSSAPPGRYFIVVAPRAVNGPIACGAKYELRVSSGDAGACCIDNGCTDLHQAACVSSGGIWRVATCQSGACLCKGDLDCDGDVDFFDIDPFVAALNPDATPNCPRMNADCDNDGDVDFFDIDPFVARLGTDCE